MEDGEGGAAVARVATEARAAQLSLVVLLFTMPFEVPWRLMGRHWPRLRCLDAATKSDNASRVLPTVYAMLVCPMLLARLYTTSWSADSESTGPSVLLQSGLIVSAAYFLSDLYGRRLHHRLRSRLCLPFRCASEGVHDSRSLSFSSFAPRVEATPPVRLRLLCMCLCEFFFVSECGGIK